MNIMLLIFFLFIISYELLLLLVNFCFISTGLVFSEYLLSGLVPSVKEVNDEEPLFPAVPLLNIKPAYRVCSYLFAVCLIWCFCLCLFVHWFPLISIWPIVSTLHNFIFTIGFCMHVGT